VQKIIVIAVVIVSLAAAALGFVNHNKLAQCKADAAKLEADSAANAKKAQKAEADLKAANEKLSVTGSDAEKTLAELTELRAKDAKSSSVVADLQQQLGNKDTLITQQKGDLTAKDARISELESKTPQGGQSSKGSGEDLRKQVEEKDILIASIQSRLKDQESQLAALKEREARRKSKTLRAGLEGKILAVNTSWNFVVLSLGDRNGVVNGAEMLIKRGSQLVGKVRITSVEPSTSIADIVPNSIRGSLAVQPGDTVIYSGPSEENETKIP
jgi:small-conductance mechanosensitive channel